MVDISRRQFLRGDFSSRKTIVRPPWARAEPAFLAACTRCCDCVNVCPQHILLLDKDARPMRYGMPAESAGKTRGGSALATQGADPEQLPGPFERGVPRLR